MPGRQGVFIGIDVYSQATHESQHRIFEQHPEPQLQVEADRGEHIHLGSSLRQGCGGPIHESWQVTQVLYNEQ